MQRTLMLAAAAAVLAAGCSESDVTFEEDGAEAVRVVERLRCPEREGGLRRVSASADGKACAYRGPNGAEVELRLAKAGDLAALDAEVRALVPTAGAAEPPEPPEPPQVPDWPQEGAVTSVQTQAPTESSSWSVRLDNGSTSWERGGGTPADTEPRAHDAAMRAHDAAMEAHDAAMQAHDAAMDAAKVAGAAAATTDGSSSLPLMGSAPGPDGWRVAGYRAAGSGAGARVVGVLRARGVGGRKLMGDIEALVNRNLEL